MMTGKRITNGLTVAVVAMGMMVGAAGAAPWTPAEITTAAWFDAADSGTITESGGAVSQWDDKSGNDKHATQGVGSEQPTTGANTINGLNALTFDGVNDTLAIPSLGMTDGACIFYVFSPTNDPYYTVVGTSDGTDGREHDKIWTGNYPKTFRTVRINNTGTGSSFPEDGLGMITKNAQTSGPNYDIFLDGEHLVAHTAAFTFSDNIDIIGSDGGAAVFTGDIAEIVVVNEYMSDPDRQEVEGYLAWKWGLEGSLPGGHPYKSAAPLGPPPAGTLIIIQ